MKDYSQRAFPSHGSMGEVIEHGMSLRDYFAAAALTGILSNPAFKENIGDTDIARKDDISAGAFLMADAMLIEREKE